MWLNVYLREEKTLNLYYSLASNALSLVDTVQKRCCSNFLKLLTITHEVFFTKLKLILDGITAMPMKICYESNVRTVRVETWVLTISKFKYLHDAEGKKYYFRIIQSTNWIISFKNNNFITSLINRKTTKKYLSKITFLQQIYSVTDSENKFVCTVLNSHHNFKITI